MLPNAQRSPTDIIALLTPFASDLGLGVIEARGTSTLALPTLVGQRIDALLADPDGDVAIALAGGGLVRVTLPDADGGD